MILLNFWNRLADMIAYPQFYILPTQFWIQWNLSHSNLIGGLGKTHIFATAIHYLWRIRNLESFDLLTPSRDEVYNHFWLIFKSQ